MMFKDTKASAEKIGEDKWVKETKLKTVNNMVNRLVTEGQIAEIRSNAINRTVREAQLIKAVKPMKYMTEDKILGVVKQIDSAMEGIAEIKEKKQKKAQEEQIRQKIVKELGRTPDKQS